MKNGLGLWPMKYSQQTGLAAAFLLIIICFLPWSYIASSNLVVSGMSAGGTHFGKPGLLNIVFCCMAILLFVIPRIWAKRTNVFVCAINLAWSVRNYILLSTCLMGECPEKKPALYALLVFAVFMQVMALFPKMELKR